ncbi:hypothetical protein ABZP36_018523 [Zizania latifolia]
MATAKGGEKLVLRKPVFVKVDQLKPGTTGHTLTVKVVSASPVPACARGGGGVPAFAWSPRSPRSQRRRSGRRGKVLAGRYAYPPPDGNILMNIVNALIAVPRFYTQVLHLMNKMNLPAPFRMALPTPPLPLQVPAPPPPPPQPSSTDKLHLTDLSSNESELESSDEEVDKRKVKHAKHEAIVGPAVDKSIAHEAVGLKPAALVSNELQVIKKKNPVLQINITPKAAQKELAAQSTVDKELVSRDELLEGKHFVTPGNPASVLYVKNLAKDVIHDDFYHVFGSVFENMDAAKSGLSIKLMQV